MDVYILFLSVFNFVLVRGDFNLTLLHTNDVHARIEQTNKYSANCSARDATDDNCYGGVARRLSAIEAVRRNHSNVLLLDAGDEFQGTVWFSYYKGLEASHFMNRLGYNAMCTGNHDFDNGASGLLSPFLKNATFPLLACNLNLSSYPELSEYIQSHVIFNLSGEEVGVIGYVTPDTQFLVDPRKIAGLTFNEILPSVRESVSILQDQGVNKIIALGHSGYTSSQHVAAIPGIDIVVDGHSNTFLYNGDPPSSEKIIGPYPTVIPQEDGGQGLVYTDYAFGKYLGMTQITFDEDGIVTNWSGNPLLMDNTYTQDPDLLEEVEKWREPLLNFTQAVIGESYVLLRGGNPHCRVEECNLGNLLADAILYKHLRPTATRWTEASIVLMNGGSIRVSLEKGKITEAGVLEVEPFRNTISLAWLSGATLRLVLEHSVTAVNPEAPPGRFLQFSGLRVSYDLTQPEGSRVVDVMVTCTTCDIPQLEPLDPASTYGVLTNDYLIGGGDKYDVLRDNMISYEPIGTLVTDALKDYIRQFSPLFPGQEGRITFVRRNDSDTTEADETSTTVSIPYCRDRDAVNIASSLQNRTSAMRLVWIILAILTFSRTI